MDKQLFNRLIQNISKGVKRSLIENIQSFNPIDYNDDSKEIIDNQTIKTVMEFDYDDFNIIVDKFKQLDMPQELKLIFFPTFSIYEYIFDEKVLLWNYSFTNEQKPLVTDKFLNRINYIKQNNITYELIISFNYYNSIVFNNSKSPYKSDQYMTLLRQFVSNHVYDINTDNNIIIKRELNDDLLNIKYTNYSGSINTIDNALKKCKELFNRYLKYLSELNIQ